MDFVGGGGGGGGGGSGVNSGSSAGSLGSENGPILYTEPNRTSASVDTFTFGIYIIIFTIFLSFFLILPGIRYEKFPTFLCITTSLIVTSIILLALFGTNWHVGDAPISAAYKAFSRDRIQGDLSVKIGLQSVNITLRAHKYYILHATHGPIIMENTPATGSSFMQQQSQHSSKLPSASSLAAVLVAERSSPAAAGAAKAQIGNPSSKPPASSLAEELLATERASDGAPVETELESDDEVFATSSSQSSQATFAARQNSNFKEPAQRRAARSSDAGGRTPAPATSQKSSAKNASNTSTNGKLQEESKKHQLHNKQPNEQNSSDRINNLKQAPVGASEKAKYTIKRVNFDINFNERFYWIEPNQMRQEHQNALERGLPYPILTVVEYLSQDAAGFSWSRQYRMAGYYSSILLWLSLCVCVLMFVLHCAAPKYGIYTMQCLGCLLLLTNFTYSILVPKDEQKLVIPFEGQSLSFKFGSSFWLVMFGGVLSLVVGTMIVIIDRLFPNFIFTTILDVDFDTHNNYSQHRPQHKPHHTKTIQTGGHINNALERPYKPPFLADSSTTSSNGSSKSSYVSSPSSASSTSTLATSSPHSNRLNTGAQDRPVRGKHRTSITATTIKLGHHHEAGNEMEGSSKKGSHLGEIFSTHSASSVPVSAKRPTTTTSDSESTLNSSHKKKRAHDSSVLEMPAESGAAQSGGAHLAAASVAHSSQQGTQANRGKHRHHHHHNGAKSNVLSGKNIHRTDHQSQPRKAEDSLEDEHQIRL